MNPRTRVPKASTLTSRPPKPLKAYLYRFKIINAPNCPSGNDNQTVEHILLEYAILKEDRERLIAAVAKAETASVV